MPAPQFNLLKDTGYPSFHGVAEINIPIPAENGSYLYLRVATWESGPSYYHLSKVKGYIPDVYN